MNSTPFQVAIIVLSDRVYAGERIDESGCLLHKIIFNEDFHVVETCTLPDDPDLLKEKLIYFSDKRQVDLILTTGGTGLGDRDFTPETTLSVIEKRIPGIEEAIRAEGLKKTPFAMLSRAITGIRNRTLIVNLPGNPKGAEESLQVVIPVLPHALKLLRKSEIPDNEHEYRK